MGLHDSARRLFKKFSNIKYLAMHCGARRTPCALRAHVLDVLQGVKVQEEGVPTTATASLRDRFAGIHLPLN